MTPADPEDAMHSHVVMFSSGAGSWAAAKRVAAKHGTENLTLLFADVKSKTEPSEHDGEDEDNYRFFREAAANVGGEAVVVQEGRNIHQVYVDEHILGNNRVAPCSKRLKQEPARNWMEENHPDPSTVTVHIGIDWTEEHRVEGNRKGWAPYTVEAPLMEKPLLSKPDMLAALRVEGIEPPRLYAMGFAHANCGGFCCRMGHAQAALLLKVLPERYAYHERKEQEFREKFGKDVSFLRDRTGGESTPLTLRTLRERIERQGSLAFDKFDLGGCGCFTPEEGA
jgi:hypothetical protein